MDGWAYVAGINVVTTGVIITAVKMIFNSTIKRVETEREDRVRVDNELWAAVNKHGHKGLDGNDAKVTR